MTKNLIVWAVILMVVLSIFNGFNQSGSLGSGGAVEYSSFVQQVHRGEIDKVHINGRKIQGRTTSGTAFETYSPGDPELVSDLLKNGVSISAQADEKPSLLVSMLLNWFPFILLIGVWLFFMRQMQGGGKGGAMSFGKSKARMLSQEKNKIRFKDVAGVDEAKEEVGELVEFLRDPSKFQKLGGHIPKGVLMTGSPGTGKTLLAKAIAGEAKVPFFTISGSDFVEMFVGVGASRVRDMFEQAKKQAPCIIFIDEIDAVGRQRGSGVGGGNDEREQTLNQLLVEMDGFEGSEGVIVIAATNRPDVLDKALLRPGRFDRQVVVPLPDIRGRVGILEVHMKKVPLGDDVEASTIARGTPGFSGADLANLVNEAALFAARSNKRLVDMNDFEEARDKIIMGPERRSVVMPAIEVKNTAYHESGHAVVSESLGNYDPVHKVTIIPRGRALGVTMNLPEEDKYSHDKEYYLSMIAVLMGGRIAEELFMNQMTTGASNDFERATSLAKHMVTRWGMSDELGPRVYVESSQGWGGETNSFSQATAEKIEQEVSRIINEQYHRAKTILEEKRDVVELMTKSLLEWESIDAEQVADIMALKQPKPPKDYTDKKDDQDDDSASGSKANSDDSTSDDKADDISENDKKTDGSDGASPSTPEA